MPLFNKKIKRLSHLQRKGLVYEKRVKDELRQIYKQCRHYDGPWIYFEDAKSQSICQPDHVVIPHDKELPALLIEAKLTWQPEAPKKLANLYAPLVQHLLPDRKLRLIQVCGGMREDCVEAFPLTLDELLLPDYDELPSAPYCSVHWR